MTPVFCSFAVSSSVRRFPSLAEALGGHGPRRAIHVFAALLADLDERGLLVVPDPGVAARRLNWLVMDEPVNNAMLFGDDAIPSQRDLREHVHTAVAVFLAAYVQWILAPRHSGCHPHCRGGD